MKTMQLSLSIIILWCLIPISSFSQTGKLIGVVDNHLVEINPISGDLTDISNAGIPNNVVYGDLAYSSSDCLFYGIINSASSPALVSLDWNGNYTFIGNLTIAGGIISLAESVAYNHSDGKLYISGSLNGGILQNDYSSESIMEVSTTNASCTFKSLIPSSGPTEGDADNMVFIGNKLYMHDGHPANDTSRFFEIDFTGLGINANPIEIAATNYLPTKDLGAIGDNLYMTNSDLSFYTINTNNPTIDYITQTPQFPEFNGQVILGLDFAPIPIFPILNTDTILCQGEDITLSINTNETVVWNTGLENNQIVINSPGAYSAEFLIGNCLFYSDTAIVTMENCDSCDSLYNQLSPDFELGNDTTICDTESLQLSINPGINNATIQWNTGETGNSIAAHQEGLYFANIIHNDCNWPSDSIFVTMEDCDSCTEVYEEIQGILSLGNDTTICEEKEIILYLNLGSDYFVSWNDGTIGNIITIDEPGDYWVDIYTENCSFSSDTITVEQISCQDLCNYYIPNAFSPQGDGYNDVFQVYFDPGACEVIEFKMLIFDRWGNEVAHTKQNEWDGSIRGRAMDSAVFVYLIEFTTIAYGTTWKVREFGDVTLVR